MRRKVWVPAGAAALVLVALIGALLSGPDETTGDPQAPPASTAKVQKGKLSAAVSQDGTLTYRARSDGSPYAVINQASGVYTELPEPGEKVACGDVLYRVDDEPVLLLCGKVPAYRGLRTGDAGRDVRQLNRNLRVRGAGNTFTPRTQEALEALQRDRGLDVTGALGRADAVFLPHAVQIAKVAGQVGAPAGAGAQVLSATSDRLHVQVDLDPSQQDQVKTGNRAQVTLPGYKTVAGKVVGFGRTAQAPAGQESTATDATIPAYISLEGRGRARGLDKAPVQVDITTEGVPSALSVPVTALVGRSGGGFGVEVVRDGGLRELVAVEVGLFDTTAGRVEVEGDLAEGDQVAVPSL